MHETLLYLILAEWIIMHQTIGFYAYNKKWRRKPAAKVICLHPTTIFYATSAQQTFLCTLTRDYMHGCCKFSAPAQTCLYAFVVM